MKKFGLIAFIGAFTRVSMTHGFIIHPYPKHSWQTHRVSSSQDTDPSMATGDDEYADEELLSTLPRSKFVSLCEQFELSIEGDKQDLLQRLRQHAEEQAALDEERKKKRLERVRQGCFDENSSKERYEVVGRDGFEDDAEDEGGFFFFALPNANGTAESASIPKQKKKMPPPPMTHPPPPANLKPNENGERVVTIYSTSDNNDLTSMASSQTNQQDSPLIASQSSSSDEEPWKNGKPQNKLPVELEEAKETVDELVRSLLSATGAPGFAEEFSEGIKPLSERETGGSFSFQNARNFTGFNPSLVEAEVLVACTKALRAGRGEILDQVLSEYEVQAVGHDGMAGDDKEKGGGHYKEVSKIRAFLEGFRRAEVKRISRETTTLLLDRLASEGIQGLDKMMMTMTKNSDDSGEVGELSDSLIDFLNDQIRDQENRVGEIKEKVEALSQNEVDVEDEFSQLWNVTNDEDGKRVETLDPQDPHVQKVLKMAKLETEKKRPLPRAAPEQLLLLLKLLRDRLKVEAAYGGHDNEHGRNLRTLAYCLKFDRPWDREKFLKNEFGASVDRLDSFLELVASSIDYADSTVAQLTPTKVQLNRPLLQEVYDKVREIRDRVSSTTAQY
mmetsp:Transcript_31962/g.47176  ORF Transcript_31962/g.47176 Transcript_31962/m.47176 type:complete len:616 (-) Transcript_31962:742-2589(-)|eukprot:CAMPEP_0194201434 /NCGR_PEP_ID=MMETSP0156-20130528/1702_1 /TAXON_ID=33649 /ORGANISM="Thalassionema nitzschioides, Strain L26-B" /LENGTH=615 /DNA_ID=CAMNT_0038926621 /DNA_START=75 /DNA_END=1922 /DNA_ORIENTATION=-